MPAAWAARTKDDVGAARELEEHGRRGVRRPQGGAVVHVEAHRDARVVGARDQGVEERRRRAAVRCAPERRRDPRDVHHADAVERHRRRVGGAQLRRRRAVAVVVHATPRVFHVQTGPVRLVDDDPSHEDAARGDPGEHAAPERICAHAREPERRLAERDHVCRDVGLGAAGVDAEQFRRLDGLGLERRDDGHRLAHRQQGAFSQPRHRRSVTGAASMSSNA